MALGGPDSVDDVGAYLKEVRHGRPTSVELVEEFRERYRRIGGKSPLLELSTRQAKALESRLTSEGYRVRAYVGMRHWHPFIRETVATIDRDGMHRVIALCLTPYYSRMSVGAYFDAVKEALRDQGLSLDVTYVDSWNDAPGLADAFAEQVAAGLKTLAREGFPDPIVLFTAHSLPRKIVDEGDPYEKELRETMKAILARCPPLRSRMAYQSAGRTVDPWLGPPFEEVIEELGRKGEKAILVVPFGFVSDHLEILYDVDIEARGLAGKHGVRLERTRSLNDNPTFISAVASVVRARLAP
jgi:protoporphyrin/coproporphyrin ferrochelatase